MAGGHPLPDGGTSGATRGAHETREDGRSGPRSCSRFLASGSPKGNQESGYGRRRGAPGRTGSARARERVEELLWRELAADRSWGYWSYWSRLLENVPMNARPQAK